MRFSLFTKIYLWFWLCIVTIIVAVAMLALMHLGGMHGSEWKNLAINSVETSGRQLIYKYESEGIDSLLKTIKDNKFSYIENIYCNNIKLINNNFAKSDKIAYKVANSNEIALDSENGTNYIALKVSYPSDSKYVLVIKSSKIGYFSQLLKLPKFILFKILFVLIISSLACFALSSSVVSSIRKIQNVTYQLARGNFSSRVLPVLGARNDELSDLAKDFDLMAQHVENLVKSQKQLLSDISHELRSPLARLTIALDICQSEPNSATCECLGRIQKESDRLNTMIGNLLEMSKFESRMFDMTFERISIFKLLTDIIDDADFEAKHYDCKVKLIVCDNCFITGNFEYIYSAIENVIRNAIRFTKQQSTIEVTSKYIKSDSCVQISVRDYGPGVPVNLLKDIFRPFYRVEASRDRATGGTGLGLAITDRIVGLHGGTVSANNAGGSSSGLTVEIRLPAFI